MSGASAHIRPIPNRTSGRTRRSDSKRKGFTASFCFTCDIPRHHRCARTGLDARRSAECGRRSRLRMYASCSTYNRATSAEACSPGVIVRIPDGRDASGISAWQDTAQVMPTSARRRVVGMRTTVAVPEGRAAERRVVIMQCTRATDTRRSMPFPSV